MQTFVEKLKAKKCSEVLHGQQEVSLFKKSKFSAEKKGHLSKLSHKIIHSILYAQCVLNIRFFTYQF